MDIFFKQKIDKVASFSCRIFPVGTILEWKELSTKKDFKVLYKYQVLLYISSLHAFFLRVKKMLAVPIF